eukprot:s4655_g3.t1
MHGLCRAIHSCRRCFCSSRSSRFPLDALAPFQKALASGFRFDRPSMPLGPLKEDSLKVSRIRAPQRDLPCTTWRKLGKRNYAAPAIEATLRQRQRLQPSQSAPLLHARSGRTLTPTPFAVAVDDTLHSPSSPSPREAEDGPITFRACSPSSSSRPATGSRLFQDSPSYSNAETKLLPTRRPREVWFPVLTGEHSVEIPFREIRESSHGEDYVWWFQEQRSQQRATASRQSLRQGALRPVSVWQTELSELASTHPPARGLAGKEQLLHRASLLRHLESLGVQQGPKALAEAVCWCFGGAERASHQLSRSFGDKVGLLQLSGLLALLDLDLGLLTGAQGRSWLRWRSSWKRKPFSWPRSSTGARRFRPATGRRKRKPPPGPPPPPPRRRPRRRFAAGPRWAASWRRALRERALRRWCKAEPGGGPTTQLQARLQAMGNLELSFRSWFSSACERSAEGILFVSLKAWISFFEDLEPHDPLRSAQLREAGGEAALQRAFEDARRKQAGDCPGLCFASFLHALAGLNQALDLRWSPVLDFFQEMKTTAALDHPSGRRRRNRSHPWQCCSTRTRTPCGGSGDPELRGSQAVLLRRIHQTLRAIPAGRASERHFRAVLEETDFRRKLPSDPKDTCDLADSGKRGEARAFGSRFRPGGDAKAQVASMSIMAYHARRKASRAFAQASLWNRVAERRLNDLKQSLEAPPLPSVGLLPNVALTLDSKDKFVSEHRPVEKMDAETVQPARSGVEPHKEAQAWHWRLWS